MAASITQFNEAKRRWKLLRPQADNVETSPALARKIVDYFQPRGLCLDPCRGPGRAFYDALPGPRDWCEIREGHLLAVQGDQGARAVLAADRARVRLVAFDDPRPLADIDTPEDYERLRDA